MSKSHPFIYKLSSPFDLGVTLDCGQTFRWSMLPDGSYAGIVGSRYLHLQQIGDTLYFYDTSPNEFNCFWRGYFDLDRDYAAITQRAQKNKQLAAILQSCDGIHVLNQPPWEALCSFIISQNNNIPRIKGIIRRLCEALGTPISNGFSFPPPETLAGLSPQALEPLRCGFRARYILDAAQKCSDGLSLEALRSLPIDEARRQLMAITGVGPKVADCTLLYGLGFSNAFPMDVWMKRAMHDLFGGSLPTGFDDCCGILQQSIFHYIRKMALAV